MGPRIKISECIFVAAMILVPIKSRAFSIYMPKNRPARFGTQIGNMKSSYLVQARFCTYMCTYTIMYAVLLYCRVPHVTTR